MLSEQPSKPVPDNTIVPIRTITGIQVQERDTIALEVKFDEELVTDEIEIKVEDNLH